MRRSAVRLEDVAAFDNLAAAYWRAAQGKRHREEVIEFGRRLEPRLCDLAAELREGRFVPSPLREFTIHDPKIRRIRAPAFRDRVVHQAMMAVMGPVLDRALVADTFACRLGKGATSAIDRAERHARALPWYAKMDVRSYFASIDHGRLVTQLARRFKDRRLIELCERILEAHAETSGRGLPIGALPSQHFANHYLGPLDRFLLGQVQVDGMVRYMDDIVVWCRTKVDARTAMRAAVEFARVELGLELHRLRVQRSDRGITFLGVRLDGHGRRPSLRRRRRYRAARARWEEAYRVGAIDSATLQRGYDATAAILHGCRATGVRQRDLAAHPAVEA